jgi:hypothetical protein
VIFLYFSGRGRFLSAGFYFYWEHFIAKCLVLVFVFNTAESFFGAIGEQISSEPLKIVYSRISDQAIACCC